MTCPEEQHDGAHLGGPESTQELGHHFLVWWQTAAAVPSKYTGHSEDHGHCQQIFEPATGSITKLFLGENKPHYKKPVCVNLHILRVQLQAMSTLTQREMILLYLLDRRQSLELTAILWHIHSH